MKNVALVNGSPQGKKSTSYKFLLDMEKRFSRISYHSVHLKASLRENKKETFEALLASDIVVFSFPLYTYTLPASFIRFLEDLSEYMVSLEVSDKALPRVYLFVNSGFPYPEVNHEALRAMKIFCRQKGVRWRFGAAVGGGLVTAMLNEVPLINRRLIRIYDDVIRDALTNETALVEDYFIRPVIPKRVMDFMKDSQWSKNFMSRR